MREELFNRIVEMDEEGSIKLAKEYLDGGGDAQVLLEVCRNAMGVTLMKTNKGEKVLAITKINNEDEINEIDNEDEIDKIGEINEVSTDK